MVSKAKKTTIKSLKDLRGSRRSWRKKSPLRKAVTASTAILASIHRRISRLLTKLTPNHKIKDNNKNVPYKLLKKTKTAPAPNDLDFQVSEDPFASVRKTLSFQDVDSTKICHLPPQPSHRRRKTVFLDLDETLVHSKPSPAPEHYDFVVRPVIDGAEIEFYVLKRPGLEEFLSALAAKFEVVIFTAALREYAELVLDRLDKDNRYVSHRLYRDSCRPVDGRLVKDLSETGRELDRVVIVDDNPNSFSKQPENAIMIKPFIDNLWDTELWKLRKFFDACDCFDDTREAISHYYPIKLQHH
ncbi:hypothetical protein HN51_057447 [Arachis hypogaea]|uniref:FCP1 homology domain-containing protein n=1 Tax=Arachis hypogaea TaxID=3818 RepID=A0A444WWY9_ARAHY|nr:CTD small phosphatase-like protein [Arachis ipaensis]XP_025684490.1 CTD small phosphatase-like protein [Arachis hypogaea]QHN80699.1 CTD small phosphatase-like protein [Arachis hypogaea]RYQ81986.1 hypothetical protein Ahy_B10g100566 [Arachis hypogaea]